MVVSYTLSRRITPLLPLSGGALRDHTQKMALSPTQRLKIGKREKAIVSHAFSFSPLSSLNSTQKGLQLRRRERMAYYEKRTPIGFSCVLSRLNCRPEAFLVARGERDEKRAPLKTPAWEATSG